MFPAWAKFKFDYNQDIVKNELLNNDVFNKAMVATTIYDDNNTSIWNINSKHFQDDLFKLHDSINHYKMTDQGKVLVKGQYDTFNMLNLTYLEDHSLSDQDSWEGDFEDKSRMPLWIKYTTGWKWRDDLDIPYTRYVVESLPFKELLTVRCIIQRPPSIGVVHKDSTIKVNQDYFRKGYGSITLNVAAGGAHLYFINHKNGKQYTVDESQHKAWHFDDSCLHCTSEVKDIRIQLRIFGQLKKPYWSFLQHHDMVY
jgi:hypothetical protein